MEEVLNSPTYARLRRSNDGAPARRRSGRGRVAAARMTRVETVCRITQKCSHRAGARARVIPPVESNDLRERSSVMTVTAHRQMLLFEDDRDSRNRARRTGLRQEGKRAKAPTRFVRKRSIHTPSTYLGYWSATYLGYLCAEAIRRNHRAVCADALFGPQASSLVCFAAQVPWRTGSRQTRPNAHPSMTP
jgi:hypothetical protein